MERLLLILKTVSLEVTEPKIFDALSFVLERLEGSPLPVRTFDHADFVYLIRQLLPRNETYQMEIPMSPVYANISDWNVCVSESPGSVLVGALSYPVKDIASDALNLTALENVSERDPRQALSTLPKNLAESREICAEKLMLDRIKTS